MRCRAILVAVLCALLAPAPARAAEPLVADLSDHRIEITTGFTGTEVLLFGAVEEEGDIVVVVRGPEETVRVWRKGRYGGIWLNDQSVVFHRVPSFYAVGSSRPLVEIADDPVLNRHTIGVDRLRFEADDLGRADAEYIRFHDALIRNKQLAQLFATDVDKVRFLGERLFRTRLYFPTNVPIGVYFVEVFLLRDGQVVNAQTTPLVVSKAGVGADVFVFARQHAALYGIMAVAAALLAGTLAAYVFRKG
jgi:uncharacterized protein (TIGR02186 family)